MGGGNGNFEHKSKFSSTTSIRQFSQQGEKTKPSITDVYIYVTYE